MRLQAFIWAFFYFISSVGYGMEVHYCLGEVSDIGIWSETYCPCDEAHESLAMSCCEEKSFFNQLDDDHQSATNYLQITEKAPAGEPIQIISVPIKEENRSKIADRGPPKTRDRLLLHQQLIVYE